jgi:predicted phage tail protein
MIAMRIKASEQLNGVPDAINCVAESYLPVYSGASWSYELTANPAWAFADLLRRRGQEVVLPDSRLDLVGIKAWADACDAPAPNGPGNRWGFNAVMEGGSIFNALRTVASHGRATPTMKDGKFSIVRDVQQNVPVQHITPRNSSNYTGSKLFLDIPEALRVRFINAARGFVEDEVIVYDDGQNEFNTEKFETIELFGCTDKNQAWREGRYHLAVMKLRPEEHIVEMDIEALRCTVGDLVLLNHDVILIGLGAGRIRSRSVTQAGLVQSFVLDGPVAMTASVSYGLRVRRSNGETVVHRIAEVPTNTNTDEVVLTTPAAAATAGEAGDLFMFGTLGDEAAPMIIKRIEAQRDLSARLVLVDAQSGVYTADTGLIPDFDDNITVEVPVSQKAPPSVTFALRSDETALLVLADGTLQDRLVVTINPVAASDVRAMAFDVQFKESVSASWVLAGRILEDDRELPITGVVQGRSYDVRVRSVSASGISSAWTTLTNHTIVGKTTRPTDVETLIATVDPQLGLTLSWPRVADLDVSYYDLRRGTNWPTGTKIAEVKGTSFAVGVLPIGTYNYRIRAVDTIGLTSINDTGVTVAITQPAAPVVSFALADDQVVLSWAQPDPQQRITDFEVAFGPSYGSATVLGRTKSTVFRATADFIGERTFWVTAVDVAGNRSAGASVVVNITALGAPIGLVASITGPDILLSWAAPGGSLSVAEYEIRYGASYAAGERITRVTADSFRFKADFAGARTFWVAGIDKAGNTGQAAAATLSITAPGGVTPSQQIVDNNVLLRWTAPTSQLPIANYQIRKGATYSTAEIIGSIDGLFSTVFESSAGTFIYWVTPVDTAGNPGAPTSIAATVSSPPDYDLLYDQFSTFSGTNVGFVADGTASAAPINNSETYEQHFTSRGWATPQAQVDAGFPYWIQPTLNSGYYEEEIDYGAALPGTRIVVTLTYQTVIGTVTVTPTISVKLNAGDAWTNYPGVYEVFASNFRYFKIRIDIESVSGDGFIDIAGLNLRLDVKLKTDSGSGTANSADTTGTTVLFNKSFIDINSITVTPKGTTARLAIYDFTDVPNPTSFKVLLFDTSGNRVSGDFSWNAKGV